VGKQKNIQQDPKSKESKGGYDYRTHVGRDHIPGILNKCFAARSPLRKGERILKPVITSQPALRSHAHGLHVGAGSEI